VLFASSLMARDIQSVKAETNRTPAISSACFCIPVVSPCFSLRFEPMLTTLCPGSSSESDSGIVASGTGTSHDRAVLFAAVNARTAHGLTPLHFAASRGHADVRAKGPEQPESMHPVSPLRDPSAPPLTFPYDPPQVVDLLLLAGADPTAACAAGIVPRTLAALHGTGAAQPHAARPAAWPRRTPAALRCAALRCVTRARAPTGF